MRKSVAWGVLLGGVTALCFVGGSPVQGSPPGMSQCSDLVLQSTMATFQGDLGGRTGATKKCQAEFPNSHFVTRGEIESAWNTGRGVVWLSSENEGSWIDDNALAQNCSGGRTRRAVGEPALIWQSTEGVGSIANAKGSGLSTGSCSEFRPILCSIPGAGI